eukprot:12340785-Heterocapsa_arctica.AAC.1
MFLGAEHRNAVRKCNFAGRIEVRMDSCHLGWARLGWTEQGRSAEEGRGGLGLLGPKMPKTVKQTGDAPMRRSLNTPRV